jgi:hypothetical protein
MLLLVATYIHTYELVKSEALFESFDSHSVVLLLLVC